VAEEREVVSEVFVEKLKGSLNLTGCASKIVAIFETTLGGGESILPHYHPDAEELYYILSGKGTMHIEEENKEVETGDVVYIPPDKVHYLHNTSADQLRFITLTVRLYKLEPMPPTTIA
jgi:mannose-6-phosphate isomerase-like protein (cupin superfamily)